MLGTFSEFDFGARLTCTQTSRTTWQQVNIRPSANVQTTRRGACSVVCNLHTARSVCMSSGCQLTSASKLSEGKGDRRGDTTLQCD